MVSCGSTVVVFEVNFPDATSAPQDGKRWGDLKVKGWYASIGASEWTLDHKPPTSAFVDLWWW